MKTINSFSDKADQNCFSRVMEGHQKCVGKDKPSGNLKILMYLADNYLYPTSFEDLVYASQLLQADAIKYGVEHFVSSNRSDRNGGNENIGRMSPVNHMMIINAQELMFISRRRLCGKAMKETREVWEAVVAELKKVDPIVADYCVPMCIYRGECFEPESCLLKRKESK